MATKIESLEQLKELSADGCDCFIALNALMRSGKHIRWSPDQKMFEIHHMIDGTFQTIDEEQIMSEDHSLIGEAMRLGRFFTD